MKKSVALAQEWLGHKPRAACKVLRPGERAPIDMTATMMLVLDGDALRLLGRNTLTGKIKCEIASWRASEVEFVIARPRRPWQWAKNVIVSIRTGDQELNVEAAWMYAKTRAALVLIEHASSGR